MGGFLRVLTQLCTYILLGLVVFYQWTFSFFLGGRCRFYPSCSEYAKTALKKHSPLYAIWLSAKRLLKCHPWHPGGVDMVPLKKDKVV